MSKKSKIAVFVDADNISHNWADTIIEKASSYGKIMILYACGTRKHLGGRWRNKIEKHKFTEKKAPDIENGTDILVVRETMDMMLKHPEIDIFCLVSNDNHFAKIPQIPRQWNRKVILMGTEKAGNLLKADSDFILLENKVDRVSPQPKKEKILKPITEFQILLEKAFKSVNQETIALNMLGKALKDIDSAYKPKIYGSSTLSKLLKRLPNIIVKSGKVTIKKEKAKKKKKTSKSKKKTKKVFKSVYEESETFTLLGSSNEEPETFTLLGSNYEEPEIFTLLGKSNKSRGSGPK